MHALWFSGRERLAPSVSSSSNLFRPSRRTAWQLPLVRKEEEAGITNRCSANVGAEFVDTIKDDCSTTVSRSYAPVIFGIFSQHMMCLFFSLRPSPPTPSPFHTNPGLRYEDLLNEGERDIAEAMALADPEVITGRTRRIKRALDLGFKRKNLQDYAPDMELDIYKSELYETVEKIRARDQEYALLNAHNK